MIKTVKSSLKQLRYFNYFRRHKYFYWKYPLSIARRFLTGSGLVFGELFFEKRCNFRCWHCSSAETLSLKDKGMTTEQIRVVLRQLQRQSAINVSYVGGETTVREDLVDIIRMTDKEFKLLPSMISNGWLLSPEKIDALFDAGLASLGLSLQSSHPEVHDELVRKKGAHAHAMAALNYCVAKKYPVAVCAVPTNENLNNGDFVALMDMCSTLGIRVNINLPAAIGSLQEEALLNEHSLQILKERFFPMDNFLPDFKLAGAGQKVWCPMGEASVYIMPDGDVCPCTFTQISFGNVLTEDLSVILTRMRGSSLISGLKREGQCPISMDRGFIAKVHEAIAQSDQYPPLWKEPAGSSERRYWEQSYQQHHDPANDPHFDWMARRRAGLFGQRSGTSVEIGAGRGEFARIAGVSVVCDYSVGAVDAASRDGGTLAVAADAAQLPFADNSVDVLYANDVFHHIKIEQPLTVVVDEIVRVLTPGGVLCVSDRLPTTYNAVLLRVNTIGRAVIGWVAARMGRKTVVSGGDIEPEMLPEDWDAIYRKFTPVVERNWRSPLHFWIFALQQVTNLLLPTSWSRAVARPLVRLADWFDHVTPQTWCQDRCVVLRKATAGE